MTNCDCKEKIMSKSTTTNNELDAQLRLNALDYAARTAPQPAHYSDILERAEKYLAFLKGTQNGQG
jgi:hypothetical protein